MTVAPRRPSLAVDTVDDALAILREHGLRASAARRLVVEALFAAGGPVSAERIAAGIAGRVPQSDPSSVYRNLERLQEVGLVRHVHLGHGPGMYVLAGSAREYLVCDACGAVRAVEPADLDEIRAGIADTFGWEAGFTHFPIVGLCPSCQGEEPIL
jgi:Fur family ferric uptake transcriptional regulator